MKKGYIWETKKWKEMKKILVFLLFTISICSAQKGKKTIITIPNAPGIIYEVGNGELFESAIKIKNAKNKQIVVFSVNGSFIMKCESKANTMAPTENPINRPGQTWPSNAKAQYFVK